MSILLGMGISIAAFGTGGKRKRIFKDIYYSVEDIDGIGVIYTKAGEYSAVLSIENPVQKCCADTDSYYEYTSLLASVLQTLGEGYAFHKQDVITRREYHAVSSGDDMLSDSYFRYFEGRHYTDALTYIVITQENRKSKLFSYDAKKWKEFLVKIRKVHDQLRDSGIQVSFLSSSEAGLYVDRFFAMNFRSDSFLFDNYRVDDESIEMGDHRCRIYSLVDVDSIDLPSMVKPYVTLNINNTAMPADIMSMLDGIPVADTIVYNQILFLPNQKHEVALLDKKKNRHSSLPSPANQAAAEDIRTVLDIVARENSQLVYAHFNIMVSAPADEDFDKCTNYLDNTFSRVGIHLSRRAYNQLELFVASFPGNCYRLSPEYDRFLTLSNAACCLLYKERVQHTEDTPLKVYYTDRQGVPLAIDITGKEGRLKLNDNQNFFCLGPSGSGKSFHMNTVVRQLHEQDTDIVLVDTGHSYEGLCEYFGGRYISYTPEHPITMNPFRISRGELNIEKIDFLNNLVVLLWKGVDGKIREMEKNIITQVIEEYYDAFFNGFAAFDEAQRESLSRLLTIKMRSRSRTEEELGRLVCDEIAAREDRRRRLPVSDLSFNSFYEYSIQRLSDLCMEDGISDIDLTEYEKMLGRFYRGGMYDQILNADLDTTLFDESFIVFEIDSISDNRALFPIVTLIIMDVFQQKMRIKKNRKYLIIEEAWKAIASPLMAGYIQYMFKTARKFWAGVGVVTQEIQDIISSPVVKDAIINNSDTMILLDQSKFKERYDEIKAILGLTDVDCRKIFTINRLDNKDGRGFFKEVFIRRGIYGAVYGVEESRECYMTYTTERAEKDALKLYRSLLRCSFRDAVVAYVRDWNMSGISSPLAFAKHVLSEGRVLALSAPVRLNS